MSESKDADNTSRLVSLFLENTALERMMIYLCKTSLGQVIDPITDVVCIMITSPIHLVITEVGIAPFKVKIRE